MNYPKISVVIPSFNQEKYIEKALLSVINQNYPNLELIVIDGGSIDGSLGLIRKYDSNISYWVSELDGGQTQGLIKGFRKSTGEIQCWLNSDDMHTNHTLYDVANYFINHPSVDAVYGHCLWVDAEDLPLREQREIPFNRFIWTYTYNYIPGQSMFWRKTIYDKVGGLNSEFNCAMDADLWRRFADVGCIGHVRKVWSIMRFYPEQKNRSLRNVSDMEDMQIRRRYWKNNEIPPYYGIRRLYAYAIRIGWKLLTGCYPIGYNRYMETMNRSKPDCT